MSGHSKWSQIKRQKGAADVKRGAVFSKITNQIILASKSGGDPNSNFTLKMAIEKAKSANMPKDNIDRAIKRGTGELGGANIEEITLEAIGPENIGIIIEAATDNKNRTNAEIRNILTKYNGKLAGSGAVTYNFQKMGKLLVKVKENRDDLELKVIDAGASDFEEQDDSLVVYTKPNELGAVKKNLDEQKIDIIEFSLTWEPINTIKIDDKEKALKIIEIMDKLDNLDDVTAVYSNFEISKEAM